MASYPAVFEVEKPERFDKLHVLVRILIILVLWALGGLFGWLLGILYIGLPVLAAVLIASKGAAAYLQEAESTTTRWLRYIVWFYAYLALLTDRLPDDSGPTNVRFEVRPSGLPTPGGALLRLLLAIPSALVLTLLWLVGVVLLVIAAVLVLFRETYPDGIYSFLRGLIRWQARLFAYLASLVEAYPPFALDTEAEAVP